jgi:nitrogen fixation NifU-like protein
MSDLRELYQSVILDHNKKPRNYGEPDGANHSAEGHNPLCGDHLTVHLAIEGNRVAKVGFEGDGCAISRASASLMTGAIEGKSTEEVEALFEAFHELLTSDPTIEADASGLGKLAVFSGVREFPLRVKCATLAWHTMRSALERDGESVTTE